MPPVDLAKTATSVAKVSLSDEIRAALGSRAKSRRRYMGLTARQVVVGIEISAATVYSWERSLPSTHQGPQEDALEVALSVPRGWLRNQDVKELPMSDESTDVDLMSAGCNTVADEILAVAAWCSRSQSRARTVQLLDLSTKEQLYATFFAERYGAAGQDNCTLESIGSRHGLTRERVRQVLAKMNEGVGGVQFIMRHLNTLEAAVKQCVPITVTDFEKQYRGLLGASLSVSDANRFAQEILGRNIAIFSEVCVGVLGGSNHQQLVSKEEDTAGIRIVQQAARSMIHSCGAAHVMLVAGAASRIAGYGISVDDVLGTINAVKELDWLAENEGWFWFGPDTPNRVFQVIRKVLAVAGRTDIEDLQQAVSRSRRLRYKESADRNYMLDAPWQVLRELLSRTPWLITKQKNDFELNEQVSPESVLSENELTVYRILAEHGGVIASNVLFHRLVKTGQLSLPSLRSVLSESPIMFSKEREVHCLRSYPYTAAALAEAQATVRLAHRTEACSRLVSAKLDQNGSLEFDQNITTLATSACVSIPGHIVRAIPAGIYTVNGIATGMVILGRSKASPRYLCGARKLLKLGGVRAGDSLRFRIHPESKQIQIDKRSGAQPRTNEISSGELE